MEINSIFNYTDEKENEVCNIKEMDPFPPEFARDFFAGFAGRLLNPIEFSKLRATVHRFAFQSGFLAAKNVFPDNHGNAFTDTIQRYDYLRTITYANMIRQHLTTQNLDCEHERCFFSLCCRSTYTFRKTRKMGMRRA